MPRNQPSRKPRGGRVSQPTAIAIGILLGLFSGWVAAAGVTLWSDGSPGGPVGAEWLVGIVVGGIVGLTCMALLSRLAGRGLLGEPERLAGGVGEESATSNPT